MAKKKAEEKALSLDQILFNCRDYPAGIIYAPRATPARSLKSVI